MKRILIYLILIFSLFFLYGKYIEPNKLTIKNYQINSSNIPNSYTKLKIIQFSDLLIDEQNINNLENIVNKINNQKPDIIFFTGDLIKQNYQLNNKDKEYIINNLKNLKCSLYKYSIIGDHDKSKLETYEEIMTNSNFQILNNEYTYLFYKDKSPLKIIGLTDIDNYDKTLSNEENIVPCYTILLTHKPDNIDKINISNINLILAGHSLNGQIRIPFIGGIIKKEGAQKYFDSHYSINNTELYISNGIGTDNFNFRLFNKPSINEYIFTK